ncbi:cilia- and flagella-associated protein 144 isoform X2 [Antennarius striatus]|uniref:cilia- and flagella-associated protein 144 isoform X2 n=1 Tax=Antennarius striatus TaxID=241820 RepID=UPI0035B0D98A
MAGNKQLDLVHQNAIHVEMIRKEQRYQKLHTEFSINPHRKLHILADKPMASVVWNKISSFPANFIDAFHEGRQEPTKKYKTPQTESQEVGWISTPLIPSNRSDSRLNFNRISSDVTKHQESALQRGIK